MRRDAEGGDAGAGRRRDATRSRQTILDAAERLFAQKGYESVSLKEIGEAAGVSRNTPSYFFGSKEGLYRAVLERVLRDAGALVEGAQANLPRSADEVPPGPPEWGLLRALGPYIDFLASRPSYVGLVEREALGRASGSGPGTAEGPPAGAAGAGDEGGFPPVISMLGAAGVEHLAEAMERGAPLRDADPRHLAASMIALCSYPFMLGGGLVRTLGIEPDDPAFIEEWKRHVVGLLAHGIFAREGSRPPDRLGEPSGREQGAHGSHEDEDPE